jgi:hypothetical protein
MKITIFARTYLARYPFAFLALLFWVLALFPGRIGSDALTLVNAMRVGESSDQWTAVYFRFLWIFTANGQILWPASLFGLFSVFTSLVFLVETITSNQLLRKLIVSILSVSPFIGNWGLTVNHETLDLAGLLLITGILTRKLKTGEDSKSWVIGIAGIFSLTSFVGSIAYVAFLSIYYFFNKKLMVGLVSFFSIVTLFASPILSVNPMNSAWKYITFLGDIKCVVQHPEAEVSPSDWNYLLSIGDKTRWLKPETCLVADFGVGSLNEPTISEPKKLIQTWFHLVSNNPQIVLEARIQRTSVVLPPILFKSQPNMISQNYLKPVGSGTGTDLQEFSELFKTSIDDSRFSSQKFFDKNPLEYGALLITFLFNQRSMFWGYGGLWLSFWLLISPFLLRLQFRKILSISTPIIALSVALFFLMPSPQPRYTGINVILGIISLIYLCEATIRIYKEKLSQYLKVAIL